MGTLIPNGDPERLRATLGQVADASIDHVCVGDHISFFVGAGSDGLIAATSLLAVQAALRVYVGLYLLPLRHPVTVARQLATIAQLAPGRLTRDDDTAIAAVGELRTLLTTSTASRDSDSRWRFDDCRIRDVRLRPPRRRAGFFSDQLLERVTGLYGVRPQVEFAEIIESVDNS